MRNRSVIIRLSCVCGVSSAAAVAQPYEIAWHKVSAGGGVSTGGAFTVAAAVGQADSSTAGALTGGSYSLTGGFWSVTLPFCTTFSPADFNHDCFVDIADVGAFVACEPRPNVPLTPGCETMDLDHDNDLDGDDFGILQRCYSGNRQPAVPGCEN